MTKRKSMAAYLFLTLTGDGVSIFNDKEMGSVYLGIESGYTPQEALERLMERVDLSGVQTINYAQITGRVRALPVPKKGG